MWIERNAKVADAWLDCHCAVSMTSTPVTFYTVASDTTTQNTILAVQAVIKAYYEAKGYSPTNPAVGVATGTDYPKTRIAYDNNDIPSLMIEQKSVDTGHGGNGTLNTDADLKNYVLMIRAYALAMLARNSLRVSVKDIIYALYQEYYNSVGKVTRGDEYLALGGLQSSTGQPSENRARQHSELIEVDPSSTITINASPYTIVEVYQFDSSKVKTDNVLSPASTSATLTVGSGTHYIRYSIKLSDGADMSYLYIRQDDIIISES